MHATADVSPTTPPPTTLCDPDTHSRGRVWVVGDAGQSTPLVAWTDLPDELDGDPLDIDVLPITGRDDLDDDLDGDLDGDLDDDLDGKGSDLTALLDAEPNPFAVLRAVPRSNVLSRWSESLLDAALGVRIAASLTDHDEVDRELSRLRDIVDSRPTTRRAAS